MISVQTVLLFIFALLADIPAEAPQPTALLEDGAVLSHVPGTAVYYPAAETWRFITAQPLTAGKTDLPAGYEMRLLPGRGLETIMAYAGGETRTQIRLTGLVTRYKGTNFLFVLDAVPVRPIEASAEEPAVPAPPAGRLITDPNETSVMPKEIFERLRVKRRTDFSRMAQSPVLEEDRMMVNRTGYFRREEGGLVFELNGFGLGAASQTCRLLPNEYRQQIERRLGDSFSRPRYTVSAIETTFQGRRYLLLQRIGPAWSQGNFTP